VDRIDRNEPSHLRIIVAVPNVTNPRDEPGISFIEPLAHEMADGVKQGAGGFSDAGTVVRMSAQDRRHSQRLAAGSGLSGGGFGFDQADQAEGSFSPSGGVDSSASAVLSLEPWVDEAVGS
jgi:hypothetical protein